MTRNTGKGGGEAAALFASAAENAEERRMRRGRIGAKSGEGDAAPSQEKEGEKPSE